MPCVASPACVCCGLWPGGLVPGPLADSSSKVGIICCAPGGPIPRSLERRPGRPEHGASLAGGWHAGALAEAPVDPGDLIYPLLPVAMFQIKNVLKRPVEVIGQVGYLLVQAVKGVAYDPPSSARFTSCLVWQAGHATVMTLLPCSLIWR